MSQEVQEYYAKFKEDMGKMKEQTPNMLSGFSGLFMKVMGEGALKVVEKELIALGIAVAIQCTPCIRLHVKKCVDAGATKEQMLETASVAVMMGGGPAYTHVPVVMDALEAIEA